MTSATECFRLGICEENGKLKFTEKCAKVLQHPVSANRFAQFLLFYFLPHLEKDGVGALFRGKAFPLFCVACFQRF